MRIWVQGHQDFNLQYNSPVYQKYIVTQVHSGENIDILNKILCEYCSMYYVWKNNLKDDIVAFCHYRRQLNEHDIDTNRILCDNSFQSFYILTGHNTANTNKRYPNIYNFYRYTINSPDFIYNDIEYYLDHQNFVDSDLLSKLSHEDPKVFYSRSIFATTWEQFNNIMEFLNGYIEFIKSKYNLERSIDWIKMIREKIISYYRQFNPYNLDSDHRFWQSPATYNTIFNEDYGWFGGSNTWRLYAYMIEQLISLYICCFNHFTDKIYEYRNFL